MGRRLPVAFGFACLVTFGLFWTMQMLVSVTGELREGMSSRSIEFVRLKRDNTPETKKREPPKREKPDQPPPPPDISMSKASLDPGAGVGAIMSALDIGDALAGGIAAAGGSDRDVVPLVRIDPDYPMRARQRKVEGWVMVEFTISKTGSIKNAVVTSSHPGTIFDRAALQAVRKWKYNPKIEHGKAVERSGVKVRLDFDMEDGA
jgi:protein TonB